MSWVTVGVAAATAVKGGLDARANKKRQEKNDAFRKAAIAYSPWTQMGDPGSPNVGQTDAFSGALGGGIQGFSIGQMGKAGGLWGQAGKNAAGASAAASGAANTGMSEAALNQGIKDGSVPLGSWQGQSVSPAMGGSPGVGGTMLDQYKQTQQLNPYSSKGVYGSLA